MARSRRPLSGLAKDEFSSQHPHQVAHQGLQAPVLMRTSLHTDTHAYV